MHALYGSNNAQVFNSVSTLYPQPPFLSACSLATRPWVSRHSQKGPPETSGGMYNLSESTLPIFSFRRLVITKPL